MKPVTVTFDLGLAFDLLDQSGFVPPGLMLNDPVTRDPCPCHAGIVDGSSRWREIHPRAGMRPRGSETHHDPVTIRDHFFDLVLQVGERGKKPTHESLHALRLR